MMATYSLSKEEFNADFVNTVRDLFKSDRLSIVIEEEKSETELLSSDPARVERLNRSIEQFKNGEVVELDIDKFLKDKT
jgi:hypothetical protein